MAAFDSLSLLPCLWRRPRGNKDLLIGGRPIRKLSGAAPGEWASEEQPDEHTLQEGRAHHEAGRKRHAQGRRAPEAPYERVVWLVCGVEGNLHVRSRSTARVEQHKSVIPSGYTNVGFLLATDLLLTTLCLNVSNSLLQSELPGRENRKQKPELAVVSNQVKVLVGHSARFRRYGCMHRLDPHAPRPEARSNQPRAV